jgi:hypothetical protein
MRAIDTAVKPPGGQTMMPRFLDRAFMVFAAALILLCSWEFAFAGPAPQTHDGFLLRLSAGVGGASTSEEDSGSKLTVSGTAGEINFAIGMMVSESLALHATLFGWDLQDPEAEITGIGAGTLNGSLSMGAFGIGLTNYFSPSNLYLSGSIGVGSISLDLDGFPTIETDPGIAVDLSLGKEWWTSDNWGIGLAGGFGFHSIKDQGGENLSGVSFAVRFSATYN